MWNWYAMNVTGAKCNLHLIGFCVEIIQNDSARLISYRNGEIDAYGARPSEYAKLKTDKQIMDKSQNFEYMPPVAGYTYVAWNQGKKWQTHYFQ